jgi:ankyrin repeat protein
MTEQLAAYLRVKTQDGDTALICSAEKGHMDCLRMLLESGADTEARGMVRGV